MRPAITLLATLALFATAHAQPLVDALAQLEADSTIHVIRVSKDAAACGAAGLGPACHEVCTLTVGQSEPPACVLQAGPPPGAPVAEGYICRQQVCKKAQLLGDGSVRIDERICSYPAAGVIAAAVDVRPDEGGGRDAYVFDPWLYQLVTGRSCCEDCWAVHRAAGLPCWADYACCLQHYGFDPSAVCGVDPSCESDDLIVVGEDEGALMHASCPPPARVSGAEVDYLGRRCLFDGRMESTLTEDGCGRIAAEGVIHSCGG